MNRDSESTGRDSAPARTFLSRVGGILDAFPDAVFLVRQDGRILYVNRMVHGLLDYTAEDLRDQSLALLLSSDSPSVKTCLEPTFASAQASRFDLNLITRAGETIPVRMYVTRPAPYASLEEETALVIVRDVRPLRRLIEEAAEAKAERKKNQDLVLARDRLEAALRELRMTQAQLIQSGKLAALGEVTSGMAHELNNPLTILQGYVERIRGEFRRRTSIEENDVARALDGLDANIERMSRIIRHVMAFSRQPITHEMHRVPVNVIVEAALSLFHSQLQRRGISLSIRLASGTPEVMADRFQIEQVVINLLANARDAIQMAGKPEGTGRIEIGTRALDEEVLIEVRDNGCGIESEARDRIFDPFFTTKDVGEGTGLGLSISHGIITGHKGSIRFETEAGAGTTFTILLPAAPPVIPPAAG